MYLAAQLVLVYSYLNFFQPVLPGFGHDISTACHSYLVEELTPTCSMLFGAECFPFGPADGAAAEPQLEHKSAQGGGGDGSAAAEPKPEHKSAQGDAAGGSEAEPQSKSAGRDAQKADQEKTHRA
mmetsp:Transcript_96313/g.220823  ORF Transcript_96313/g.220823 Transcript_96313/m.220823 type:complete len:125 (+) Transcript_96313:275-649(+)